VPLQAVYSSWKGLLRLISHFPFQLQETAMDQASDVFKTNEDHDLLMALKTAGLNSELNRVNEITVKFEEHSEQLQEVGMPGSAAILDQLQLVPSGGDSGPRRDQHGTYIFCHTSGSNFVHGASFLGQ
jgi:hypothetical protein